MSLKLVEVPFSGFPLRINHFPRIVSSFPLLLEMGPEHLSQSWDTDKMRMGPRRTKLTVGKKDHRGAISYQILGFLSTPPSLTALPHLDPSVLTFHRLSGFEVSLLASFRSTSCEELPQQFPTH